MSSNDELPCSCSWQGCKNRGKYLILWNTPLRPVKMSNFNQHELVCAKHLNELRKTHTELKIRIFRAVELDIEGKEKVVFT